MDCIHVIHTDIVKIWNFYDPLKVRLIILISTVVCLADVIY